MLVNNILPFKLLCSRKNNFGKKDICPILLIKILPLFIIVKSIDNELEIDDLTTEREENMTFELANIKELQNKAHKDLQNNLDELRAIQKILEKNLQEQIKTEKILKKTRKDLKELSTKILMNSGMRKKTREDLDEVEYDINEIHENQKNILNEQKKILQRQFEILYEHENVLPIKVINDSEAEKVLGEKEKVWEKKEIFWLNGGMDEMERKKMKFIVEERKLTFRKLKLIVENNELMVEGNKLQRRELENRETEVQLVASKDIAKQNEIESRGMISRLNKKIEDIIQLQKELMTSKDDYKDSNKAFLELKMQEQATIVQKEGTSDESKL